MTNSKTPTLSSVSHHYEVEIFITTFGVYEPYKNIQVFKADNIRNAKQMAHANYENVAQRLKNQGGFILPFASPENFIQGENACYSVFLSLVQTENEMMDVYTILGGGESIEAEALAYEQEILSQFPQV